jgi:hypothetical protein
MLPASKPLPPAYYSYYAEGWEPDIAACLPLSNKKVAPIPVIIEIFVTKYQTINPLAHQLLDTMLDIARVAVVDETSRQIPQ